MPRHRIHRFSRLFSALACALALLAALPALAAAATREPLSLFHAELRDPAVGMEASARRNPRALSEATASPSTSVAAAPGSPQVGSTYYGPEQVASVLATLESLRHGPEMAQLSVYVATPTEIAEICGEAVLACYFPGRMEMVVSGADRPIAGVPRDFAIAHEYGHHIANTQRGELFAPIEAGTIRWATYERVCQFTRARRLYPGDQGSHYWEDPEEAFAETYAQLADPGQDVSWQYTPLLAPSPASLSRVGADLAHPWSGPVSRTISGTLAAPPAARRQPGAVSGDESIAGATAVANPAWVAERRIETPLDGSVAVSLSAPEGAELAVTLRDPASGRALSHGVAAPGQSAEISYANCGRDALSLEVRTLHGAGPFEAIVRRP